MDAIELLLTRQSDPRLIAPGPNDDQLSIIKQAALRVPDHGCIAPWQFIVVEGEGRERLGEIYHQSAIAEQQDEKVINRAKELPLRAPMIIIAIAKYQAHPKVPRVEQVQSAGCAVLAMQQAAFAQGLGGVWRTGYFAQSDAVKGALSLTREDEIVGYLYLGTPAVDCKKSVRHSPEHFFTNL
ncbi:nitroreductase [Pseudoalteromonas porphyrae]|uniref:Putative NAD(P)H nitroreductase n=2 Tax=Pseudoalteromonas TaxID=53246 RepID=A0A0N0M0P7_9GAMM|nr:MULTISPECIES: NAD(P)H nitroreductase [Pseudoalteromonas]KPH64301.1 nitroreductase [Pseudoalteromonas porphyrae]KPH96133.1 nitroreductase [Pseudoalteromonas porphyrae]NMR24086.1 NAD(P)H nitroreductase [Pseudoalteromonas sp. NEC-BIFX-2020_015]NNG43096.1 NAD(P)H nitroreductase [Pseudoalteromonas sp. NEC-BIFX-2020_002]